MSKTQQPPCYRCLYKLALHWDTVLKSLAYWVRKETDCLFVYSDGGNFPPKLRTAFTSVSLSLSPRWTLKCCWSGQSVSCMPSESQTSHLSSCRHHVLSHCCPSSLISASVLILAEGMCQTAYGSSWNRSYVEQIGSTVFNLQAAFCYSGYILFQRKDTKIMCFLNKIISGSS